MRQFVKVAGILLVVAMLGVALSASAAEVCPEEGKVESQVDGDLDGIVLPAGTLVCIKGGQTLVEVIADGESTLAELLGTGQNVSHYTVLDGTTTTTEDTSSTTTTTPTTTTEAPTTTTTEATTTTLGDTTTTSLDTSSTTTTLLDSTTTTTPMTTTSAPPAPTTTPPSDPGDELPFTGIPVYVWSGLALALLGAGGYVLRLARQA